MKNFMKNKQAMEPSTLTWIAAMFIIFFILIIFITASLAFSKGKFGIPLKVREEAARENLILTEEIVAFLNTKTEFNSQETTIKELILSSLDSYIDDKSGVYFIKWKFGGKNIMERLGGNINTLDGIYKNLISSELGATDEGKKAREREKFIFSETKKIFSPTCEGYIIKLPQGVIARIRYNAAIYVANLKITEGKIIEKDFDDFISEAEALDAIPLELKEQWTDWTIVEIPYKNQVVEIKSKILKGC